MQLSRALKLKCPQYAKRHYKVIFKHNNAQPHIAKVIKDTLGALQWDVQPHPPNSPDIASSIYHLFWSMIHGLAEQHFFQRSQKLVQFLDCPKKQEIFNTVCCMVPEGWGKIIVNNQQHFE